MRQGSRASSRAANSVRSRRRRSRGRSAPGRISPMSVARVWALPGLGGMGGLRAEFAAGTETPHPSHRKKQALPAVHPNSKPCQGYERRHPDRLSAFAATLSKEDVVVVEATGNAAAVAAVIGPHVKRVVIANPKQVRVI